MTEDVLRKWDSLFEELKKFVELDLPKLEESVKKSVERVRELESKLSSFERRLERVEKKLEEVSEKISAFSSFNELESVIEEKVLKKTRELGKQLEEKLTEIKGSEEPPIEELRRELEDVRRQVSQLSIDLSQLKSSVTEKYWVVREKKVESKSPRIL